MNEQAIIDSYNIFVKNGYNKSLEDYKRLIASNPNALNDSYNLFVQNGYNRNIEDYKKLVGVSGSSATPAAPAQQEAVAQQPKKKEDTTALPSGLGSSASSESTPDPNAKRFAELALKQGPVQDMFKRTGAPLPSQPVEGKRVDEEGYIDPRKMLGMYPTKEEADRATAQAMADISVTTGERKEPVKKGGQSYVENLFTNLGLGAAYFNEGIASIPESTINLLAIPQNYVAEKTGWDIGVTAEGIKDFWGITNPMLDYAQEGKKVLNGEVSKFIAERYEDPSIVGNFQKGNYQDGFELLGSAISQSLPTSIGLMVGGAKMTPAQLAALSTIVFTEGQRQELEEMDPTMSEAEKTTKALGMAAAESVFSSIGTGTIGKVYKDIVKREGAEAAKGILKDGLVVAYKKALEKSGPVAGFIGNSLEEAAVQISQNVISGRPAFEGAADAFVTGGGQGVVFTAPIAAINAKRYVQDKVESYQTKEKIGQILGEKADDINNLYNVPVSSEITTKQLEIANLPKAREILVNRLKKAVADNKMTEDDAKQSLFVFDKIQQVSSSLKDLDVSADDKAKIATLLRQRDELKTKIQNKDDVLVLQEKRKIEEINNQIQEIIDRPITPERIANDISQIEIMLSDSEEGMINIYGFDGRTYNKAQLETKLETLKQQLNAFQEQAAGQVPVQPTAGVGQEVEQGVSQAEPQVTTQEGVQEEVSPTPVVYPFEPVQPIVEAAPAPQVEVTPAPQAEPQQRTVSSKTQKKIDKINEARRKELDEFQGRLDRPYFIGDETGPTVEQFINNKYDEQVNELIAAEPAKPKAKATVSPAVSPVAPVVTEAATTISPEPAAEPVAQAEAEPTPAETTQTKAQPTAQPTTIKDILRDIVISFAPETAVEIEKGTREDTTGRKFKNNVAITAQATDKNGTPIGLITKRVNEDGTLSFTVKNSKGQNVNKGKAYPTERDARTALAEQVNRVRAKAAPAPKPAAVNKKASEVLAKYEKGTEINLSELETVQPPSDSVIKTIFDEFKKAFKNITIVGKRATEGAAFYDTVKKRIELNKNSTHWNEVSSESLVSNLAHEFVHQKIDSSENKQQIETELEKIKQDLIAEPPTFENESDKKIFSFITSKNNSPQEVLTYMVSNPELRKYLGKHEAKLNEISQQLFGIDVIQPQQTKQNEQVQPQPRGDRGGRTDSGKTTPLKGAPTVPGINGPDPQLVAVAEKYAADNGIDLKRQAEYVEVDEVRAKRIADAYEQMAHDPQNPKVKEAYQDLIKQTIAQYKALVDAGYKFWFMDLNIPSNVEYASSPYNALRDMRNNKQMGVFPTTDGFGTSDLDVNDNPLLEDTGFRWPVGGLDGPTKPVLANDLFRAVHDAFGHGLEGAGFRARGEENAWQAHVRLFTGPAIGAITSETRGQNSWLNFGPFGENNRTAKVEDTVFADQKTGLMPEWTWTEGRAADMEAAPAQEKAGKKKAVQTDDILAAEEESKGALETARDFVKEAEKFLDNTLKTRANDALLGIPLTVAQGVVKGIRVLLDGGIRLRDAIRRIANENNISEQKIKDLLDLATIGQEFNNIMARADSLINRQKGRGVAEERILKNLEAKLRKEPAYINATDAQRKIMEREVRAKMGAEPRKAASIGRVIGALKDITNVTREEKLKIIGRIRELGRDVAKDLAAEIRGMANTGKITAKQAADVVARFGKVNMLNEISVSNFVDYMAKVFANAEYVSQLETANSTRKKLRSLSKDKNKSANLRDLAAKFVEIDPTMVEDIAAYNEVAKKIKESVEGSSIKGKDVKFADIVKEGTVVPYIDETLKAQNEKLYQERLKEAKDILGIDAKDLSYDELLVLLSEGKEKEKQEIRFSFENLDTNELMNSIINAFDVYSSILESAIRTGVDPFTGEQVTYTESQKKLISEFIKMDLNILSPKQALEAVDSLLNFIQNNSTAKMESILRAYQGEANIRGLVEDKVKASPLRKYWSKPLGQTIGEQLTNLDLLIEKMFKGFRRGLEIANAIGLNDIKNGKASAMSESNKIVNEYVAEFFDKKANGEAFNTDFNDVERGMTAFMMRNVVGTEAEMRAEFNRRKQLIKESIDELAQGDEREVEYSEVYQEVYDKILKDAKTIEDVTSKVDKVNLDAIKFWQSKWSEKYEELSDVSLNVYNKVLEKDINYTPDRLSKLSTDNEPVEISTDDMVFHSNNGTIYKKETGVLMQATRPKSLPKNSNTGLPSRYVSLSFDKNNSNAMYDALVDIKTAGPVRQAEAFINSKYFRKLVPQSEDATILQNRIKLYVNNIRNKNPYSNDAASKLIRGLNSIASIGVGQALGGVFQPIKQMIPIGVNTLVNAKGLDVASMFDKAKQEFLNNSGYGIANRGVESQAQIESLNKLIKKASESKGDKAIKLLEEANRLQLKMFLVKPDAYIARASWITYYEKELNRLGIDPKTIDYTTHKINKKAADYAEAMVNRQQNVSDADLAGNLLAGRSDGKQMFVKLLMPFASFRMNQSARIGADIGTFLSKTATKEDKRIAAWSLSGFAAEMVTFRAISIGTGLVISAITSALMGTDEEEDEKKKDSIIKGQLTSVVADIFSPIPYTDKFIQSGVAGALDIVQDAMDIEEEDRLTIFSGKNQELLESLGLFGISAARAAQLIELIQLSTTGEYRDNFGKKKYISDDRKEALRLLIGPAILSNIGLLPVEVNSVVRSSIAASKKKSSTKEGGPETPDYQSESIKRMEEDLLEGYENKTEMKRYDPELYERNFGEGSEYYEATKEQREEEKKLEEEKQKEKDAEYGYTEGKKGGFGSKRKKEGGFGSKKNKESSRWGSSSKKKSKWD